MISSGLLTLPASQNHLGRISQEGLSEGHVVPSSLFLRSLSFCSFHEPSLIRKIGGNIYTRPASSSINEAVLGDHELHRSQRTILLLVLMNE